MTLQSDLSADLASSPVTVILKRVRDYCQADPQIARRYDSAKQVVRAFRTPSFYEVSTRCNLYCEGCYYFENSDKSASFVDGNRDMEEWRGFFAQEAARRVSMAYFVGAEPALHQDRLVAAAPYFPHGNIGTNGTIRMDADVPFRIGVSAWAGDDKTDRQLRGASVFRKAVQLYQGDPRAIILYTVSAWNIGEIKTVAQICADHGIDLTFNFYSPTHAFNAKVAAHAPNDTSFFRHSRDGHTPCLGPDDLVRARETLEEVLTLFPETVIYSSRFNRWITGEKPRYDLDAEGIALNCGSRISGRLWYYRTDLERAAVKCATPDVDCATCRMYSGGWSSRFAPRAEDVASLKDFSEWLDMIEVLGRIFIRKNPHYAAG